MTVNLELSLFKKNKINIYHALAGLLILLWLYHACYWAAIGSPFINLGSLIKNFVFNMPLIEVSLGIMIFGLSLLVINYFYWPLHVIYLRSKIISFIVLLFYVYTWWVFIGPELIYNIIETVVNSIPRVVLPSEYVSQIASWICNSFQVCFSCVTVHHLTYICNFINRKKTLDSIMQSNDAGLFLIALVMSVNFGGFIQAQNILNGKKTLNVMYYKDIPNINNTSIFVGTYEGHAYILRSKDQKKFKCEYTRNSKPSNCVIMEVS